MDMYPNPMFSISHLFEPTSSTYSSQALSEPVIAQGIFIAEDFSSLIANDDVLRIYLDKTFKSLFKFYEQNA